MRHGKAHMQATTVSTLSLLELLFPKMAQTTQLFSSEMPEIIGICDRAYVMNSGRIVGELMGQDITQTKIMQCIQGGEQNGGS